MPTLVPSSEDVRIYEVAVMLAPDLDQKAESTLVTEVEQLFTEAQAKLLFKDPWSKRGLAYPIARYNEAKFIVYYYELIPAAIREIDKQLRLMKGILRHMILLPPPGYEAVSYETNYQEWLKNRETASDMRERKKEEKLQKTVSDQAKRKTKSLQTIKKVEAPAKPIKAEEITSQIDKMIADDDLKI